MMKASRGGYTDVVDELAASGGNVNAHNIEEYTATDYASRYEQEPVVQLLQEYGAEDQNAPQSASYSGASEASSSYADDDAE